MSVTSPSIVLGLSRTVPTVDAEWRFIWIFKILVYLILLAFS